ncbi:hypothetical protein [Rickettsia felis]|nr:hypothetical protein [Rickettsia felis]
MAWLLLPVRLKKHTMSFLRGIACVDTDVIPAKAGIQHKAR